MNWVNYLSFLTDHFVKWYHSIDPKTRYEVVFMKHNASSHVSKKTRDIRKPMVFFGNKLLDWPASSPGIIESLWLNVKIEYIVVGDSFATMNSCGLTYPKSALVSAPQKYTS